MDKSGLIKINLSVIMILGITLFFTAKVGGEANKTDSPQQYVQALLYAPSSEVKGTRGLLDPKSFNPRVEAAQKLAEIKYKPALEFLRKSAINDINPLVRFWSIIALGEMEDSSDEGTDSLIKALSDNSDVVRFAAIYVIGKLKIKKAIPYLINILKRRVEYLPPEKGAEAKEKEAMVPIVDPNIRQAAIIVLSSFDIKEDDNEYKDLIDVLIKIATHEDIPGYITKEEIERVVRAMCAEMRFNEEQIKILISDAFFTISKLKIIRSGIQYFSRVITPKEVDKTILDIFELEYQSAARTNLKKWYPALILAQWRKESMGGAYFITGRILLSNNSYERLWALVSLGKIGRESGCYRNVCFDLINLDKRDLISLWAAPTHAALDLELSFKEITTEEGRKETAKKEKRQEEVKEKKRNEIRRDEVGIAAVLALGKLGDRSVFDSLSSALNIRLQEKAEKEEQQGFLPENFLRMGYENEDLKIKRWFVFLTAYDANPEMESMVETWRREIKTAKQESKSVEEIQILDSIDSLLLLALVRAEKKIAESERVIFNIATMTAINAIYQKDYDYVVEQLKKAASISRKEQPIPDKNETYRVVLCLKEILSLEDSDLLKRMVFLTYDRAYLNRYFALLILCHSNMYLNNDAKKNLLIRSLSDCNSEVRALAAELAGFLENKTILSILYYLSLSDEDFFVRSVAKRAIIRQKQLPTEFYDKDKFYESVKELIEFEKSFL